MYEDSVVLLAWFLFLKVELCSLILALSSRSVKPMYVCFGGTGCNYVTLVDDGGFTTITLNWTVCLVSAVTRLLLFLAGIQLFVVTFDNSSHVWCAAVTYFNVMAIKQFV